MYQTKVKIKPLSVNGAWKGRRFKTDKYKIYERDMFYLLPKTKYKFEGMLRVELFFGFSNKASDLDNPAKMTIDILQKKFGFNDKDIYELNIRKCIVPKGEEFISIVVANMLPFEETENNSCRS